MNIRKYFAILFVMLSCFLIYTNSEYRIVGGGHKGIRHYPYLVSIHFGINNHCVGSLVTDLKVVTAANCVVGFERHYLRVSAGVTDLRHIFAVGQTRNVVDVFHPCTYDPVTLHMDIAMLKVHAAFILGPTVDTINFYACTFETSTEMRVSGWGWKTAGYGQTSNILQTTVLYSLSRNICEMLYDRGGRIITSTMICAAGNGADVCNEDFGTPGVVNGHLCAVASYSMGCANPNYPTVFTIVFNTEVMDFLNDAILR